MNNNLRSVRALSFIIIVAVLLGMISGCVPGKAEEEYIPLIEVPSDAPTLVVDVNSRDHEIIHGSAGFLYGISNEGVPDVNTLTPLKPKVLATKGALGTEHPYGDALDVAEEFFLAGGEQVQMYCSNYYGVFGVTAKAHDYGVVLKNIIAPAVAEWKDGMRGKYPDIDSRIVYIPINEGTPVNGVPDFNDAWKIYYDSIKASDPNASIAGPNDSSYRGHNGMASFLQLPDSTFPTYTEWFEAGKEGTKNREDCEDLYQYLDSAERMLTDICKKYSRNLLLHGDLHHENILKNEKGGYTVIDPKGVIGDPVFDLSRFILDEFRDDLTSEPKDVIIDFVQKFGDSVGIPCEILLKCLYIETVIWLFREELAEGESLEECEQLITNMKVAYGFVMDIQEDITKI